MKKLKEMLSLTMACALMASLASCSSDTGSSTSSTTSTGSSSSSSSSSSTPADSGTTTDDSETETTEDSSSATSVSISSKNGEGDFVDMEVPYAPERIAFLDYVSLDMCAALGILDEVEFMAVQDALPDYLASYIPAGTENLGGLKTYQEDTTIMTTILEFEPSLIFTSGRSAADYESFLEITEPDENGMTGVVSSSITYVPSTYESFKEINTRNASIFGKETEMAELIAQYDDRLEELKSWGEGKTAMMTIFTGGAMNVLGNESRCSMIFNDLGFDNVGTDVDTSHGDTASYEALLLKNPDYIFVLDRDSAISAEGATGALDLLDNEIVQQSDAWKNGKVVVLDPIVWYMAEGGILAMDTMLSDLEAGMALED